jgi:rhodanese-related sulfurtransferase
MKKYFLLPLILFLMSANVWAIAPVKVIGATTVTTVFAKKLHEQGITFIDVRKKADYEAGHIPGAKNIPLDSFTSDALSAVVNKKQQVIFYCNGIRCDASSTATKKALEWGWTSVYYYRSGFPDWKRTGLEFEQ